LATGTDSRTRATTAAAWTNETLRALPIIDLSAG
jgi:hypothetical protein